MQQLSDVHLLCVARLWRRDWKVNACSMFQEGAGMKRPRKIRWEFGSNMRFLLRNNMISCFSEPYEVSRNLKHIATSTPRKSSFEKPVLAELVRIILLKPSVHYHINNSASLPTVPWCRSVFCTRKLCTT